MDDEREAFLDHWAKVFVHGEAPDGYWEEEARIHDWAEGLGPPVLPLPPAPDAPLPPTTGESEPEWPNPDALLLTKAEAASLVRMSIDSFERHVIADLRVLRRGAMVRIPRRQLEDWIDRESARALKP